MIVFNVFSSAEIPVAIQILRQEITPKEDFEHHKLNDRELTALRILYPGHLKPRLYWNVVKLKGRFNDFLRLEIESCYSNSDFRKTTYPTFKGRPDKLLIALDSMEKLKSKYSNAEGKEELSVCSLHVRAPSSETLDKLIRASFSCVQNPGTIGVVWNINAFIAVKTVDDMRLLLKNMKEPRPSGFSPNALITLHELKDCCSKGVF